MHCTVLLSWHDLGALDMVGPTMLDAPAGMSKVVCLSALLVVMRLGGKKATTSRTLLPPHSPPLPSQSHTLAALTISHLRCASDSRSVPLAVHDEEWRGRTVPSHVWLTDTDKLTGNPSSCWCGCTGSCATRRRRPCSPGCRL